jgi:transposase-like protein
MICPNCKAELSRIWQPQRTSKVISIVPAHWSCGTCGESFSREQLRPAAKPSKAGPPLPVVVL